MGIGPGLGNDENSLALLTYIFTNYQKPVVIDADALNLLAEHKQLVDADPEGQCVNTAHEGIRPAYLASMPTGGSACKRLLKKQRSISCVSY